MVDVLPHAPPARIVDNPGDYIARAAFAIASLGGSASVELHGVPSSRPGATVQNRKTPAALATTAAAREIAREKAVDESNSIRPAGPDETFACICLCGVLGQCDVRTKDGRIFIYRNRMVSKTGLHPPNSKSRDSRKCTDYIPLDDAQRSQAVVQTQRGGYRKQKKDEKIAFNKAVADYRAGIRAVPLTQAELDVWVAPRTRQIAGPVFNDSGSGSEADVQSIE